MINLSRFYKGVQESVQEALLFVWSPLSESFHRAVHLWNDFSNVKGLEIGICFFPPSKPLENYCRSVLTSGLPSIHLFSSFLRRLFKATAWGLRNILPALSFYQSHSDWEVRLHTEIPLHFCDV